MQAKNNSAWIEDLERHIAANADTIDTLEEQAVVNEGEIANQVRELSEIDLNVLEQIAVFFNDTATDYLVPLAREILEKFTILGEAGPIDPLISDRTSLPFSQLGNSSSAFSKLEFQASAPAPGDSKSRTLGNVLLIPFLS